MWGNPYAQGVVPCRGGKNTPARQERQHESKRAGQVRMGELLSQFIPFNVHFCLFDTLKEGAHGYVFWALLECEYCPNGPLISQVAREAVAGLRCMRDDAATFKNSDGFGECRIGCWKNTNEIILRTPPPFIPALLHLLLRHQALPGRFA